MKDYADESSCNIVLSSVVEGNSTSILIRHEYGSQKPGAWILNLKTSFGLISPNKLCGLKIVFLILFNKPIGLV